MAEFFSEIKTILCRQEKVYEVLSDMNSLERIKNQIPHEKVKDFIFDRDSCSFEVSPVGKVKFSIAEKNPPDSIKLTANESPIEV
ncbi:MAG: SRPBCC family protein, partial [Dysgonamonadaceae bacterium]|nr:SRPBCC family protein [Dysgonamonadaceae bacterium]